MALDRHDQGFSIIPIPKEVSNASPFVDHVFSFHHPAEELKHLLDVALPASVGADEDIPTLQGEVKISEALVVFHKEPVEQV